jgi:hypothetical protein
MQGLDEPGGALVVVDKVHMQQAMSAGLQSFDVAAKSLGVLFFGAKPDDILRKELILAGYQLPLDPLLFPKAARTFFQVGSSSVVSPLLTAVLADAGAITIAQLARLSG